MPTPEEIRAYSEAQNEIKVLLVAELVKQWQEHVVGNPSAAVDDLRAFVVDIVAQFGQAAAATAVDFYNSVRPAGAPPFSPVPFVRDDLVSGGSLNWVTQPLLTDEWEKALDRTAAEIQKAAMQAAIETLGEATNEDPLDVKYARWPKGDDPCAYCILRASRGAVYWSESTAERGDHLDCDCEITPVFPGETLPYLRKPYLTAYQAGREYAENELGDPSRSPNPKAILAGMRRAGGLR